MVLFDLYAAQGWLNVFGSLECTQEEAGYLACHCISDYMGICRSCWSQVARFGLGVQRALCTYQLQFCWDR